MKKKLLLAFSFLLFLLLLPNISNAEINIGNENLYNNLKGKIILRVEANGEAYYVHPEKQKMYYLGRPANAFQVMHEQGIGITNNNLDKISIYAGSYHGANNVFANQQKGKIFLQVEKNGEAWYVNPGDSMRYYLGRPADAFGVMRKLGVGINEDGFEKLLNINIKNYSNNKINISLEYPEKYTINEPTPAGDVVTIKQIDKNEYLQIQLMETTPPSVDIYKPNGADFIATVEIDAKTAQKSFTNNPIGEGALRGYSFTNYLIIINNKKWIQIQYYGDNKTKEEFENIIKSIKFIK